MEPAGRVGEEELTGLRRLRVEEAIEHEVDRLQRRIRAQAHQVRCCSDARGPGVRGRGLVRNRVTEVAVACDPVPAVREHGVGLDGTDRVVEQADRRELRDDALLVVDLEGRGVRRDEGVVVITAQLDVRGRKAARPGVGQNLVKAELCLVARYQRHRAQIGNSARRRRIAAADRGLSRRCR